MPHTGHFDNTAASDKAVKKTMQAKGLGHPTAVDSHPQTDKMFQSAPVVDDAPNAPSEPMETLKNPHSAGTDSAVRAAGATGTMEVARDAPMRNLPPETVDVDKL
ncbi:uncharacterized protein SCHCODRAFT_02482160 [Schizophyllum commune H4-8]|uniref:Uncharacterized protein n=1 Tax=Schizophyllum commune (strain H4-8 / FGSC 9210) TaxID=578458 RepID=D8PU41_SCHCM|nr:uncharacterized protein SCHCODRAFT_02482160 [Schizophyllum commune H4-8]KAI5899162.1 hypothetical protein SCHCODRAFT_02482160 [Schizophyllum commune H4-8]